MPRTYLDSALPVIGVTAAQRLRTAPPGRETAPAVELDLRAQPGHA
ncbi:MAG: hypothetical protein IT531_22615 [Burkholderiales bacterium]|nr:hypothetical protein [Burkholderiales bacterium]